MIIIKVNIGIVQSSVSSDKNYNIEKAINNINNFSSNGANIIVLPEMFNCPYDNNCFPKYAEKEGGYTFQKLSEAAKLNNIYLVAGSVPEVDENKIYNTSYVFGKNGELLAKHRKIHLFDIDVKGGQYFKESDTLSAGDKSTVFETEYCKIGLCICYDMRFPELSRNMVLDGAKVIIVPAAFNMTTGPAHWELLFRQRAVDNQVYTIGCAPARDENASYIAYGNSIAVSPWGDVIYRADEKEQNKIVEIDIDFVDKIREQLPLLKHRKPEIYKL